MALTMDELARAAQLGVKHIMEEVSWHDIMKMSYEAGGVHPTIVGYALGAIAVIFYARCSLWVSRLAPAALCILLLLRTRDTLERKSFEWLLMIAAGTGVSCTYMQLASLDLVKEHVFRKNKLDDHTNHKKHD